MQEWIKIIKAEEMQEGQLYFLGRHYNQGSPYHESCDFLSQGLNGKGCFSSKPGIAVRFTPDEARRTQERNPLLSLVVIQIPADADRRWKARTKRHFK